MTRRREFDIGINALLRKVRATCPICEQTTEPEPGFHAVATSGPGVGYCDWLHDACAERHRSGVTEQLEKLRQGWPDGDHAEFLSELILQGAEDVIVDRDGYGEMLNFVHLVFGQASRILFDGDEDYEPDEEEDEEEEEPTRPSPNALRSGQIEQEVQAKEESYDRSQRG